MGAMREVEAHVTHADTPHVSTEREAEPKVQMILVLSQRCHISFGPVATHSMSSNASWRNIAA
jgi:hypothetical protein